MGRLGCDLLLLSITLNIMQGWDNSTSVTLRPFQYLTQKNGQMLFGKITLKDVILRSNLRVEKVAIFTIQNEVCISNNWHMITIQQQLPLQLAESFINLNIKYCMQPQQPQAASPIPPLTIPSATQQPGPSKPEPVSPESPQPQEQPSSEDDVVDEDEDEDLANLKPKFDTTHGLYEEEEVSQDGSDVGEEDDDKMIEDTDQEDLEEMPDGSLKAKKQGTQGEKNANGHENQYKRPKTKQKVKLYNYQNILFSHSLDTNRIIYLPTGKGKTLVAIASMYYYLCKNGDSKKIIFLANTIQLVKQQADSIRINMEKIMKDEELSNSLRKNKNRGKVLWTEEQIKQKICCIHGEKSDDVVGQTRRKKIESELSSKKEMLEMFNKSTIIVMIAQMFLNCLRRGYIKITDFSFMVLDECHHCHGDHPYAGIMREFYFNPPKPDLKEQKRMELREQKMELPIIMGLTASPVMQETFDKNKLIEEIQELCSNLDSRFTYYEIEKIKGDTVIEVVKVVEPEHRESVPRLIAHFQKFRDHKESYVRIKSNFPEYFQCVDKIIEFLTSRNENLLGIEANPTQITDIELLLFYDIKECLLTKLRDVWLELGEYAFVLAFEDLYLDLGNIVFKTEENKASLNQIKEIIKEYIIVYQKKFGICQPKYFSAKVNKLLELLQSKTNDSCEMVVVFASKRRTVKYLQKLIENYSEKLPQQQKNHLKSGKVTGYSVGTAASYSTNQTIFESDPSSFRFYPEAERRFNIYISEQSSDTSKKTSVKDREESESRNLASQLRRMKSVKYGKMLLEVQQKYSTQISTIRKFRGKQFRILITTSVTEQGFDIPHCKIVVSFDKPTSLKSYIQIKGRARQIFSKYFIFTSDIEYEKMCSNKDFYDDVINATYEIAINKFSDKAGQPVEKVKMKPSILQADYKRIIVRSSGALINTNYALEILKMYCASLRHPNKPMFYFVETPNLAFKCLIYFPVTARTSKPYIIGESKQSKNLALKSAAFEAVKYLYEEKFIKEDLRPKKYDQIQDERELEKFQDLEETRKNEAYRRIFQEEVRIKCQNVSQRKFMRFYFRTIKSSQLDFDHINPAFAQHKQNFKAERFPFQVYMMNFNNSKNLKEFNRSEDTQEVGVLTCFESKYVEEAFSKYEYSFEENSSEKFTLKLEEDCLMLNKTEYETLKRAHDFIVAASLGREIYHYSKLTEKKPFVNAWAKQLDKANFITEDPQRQYYPIMVILKKKNGKYSIDQACLKNIEQHEKVFKAVYEFQNYSGKQLTNRKFPLSLKNEAKTLNSLLMMKKFDESLLVQSLDREHCFSKCIISGKEIFVEDTKEKEAEKKILVKRNKNLFEMFDHVPENISDIVKIVYWAKYKKEKKKEIFQRDGKLGIREVQNSKSYLPAQFCVYPLTSALLFKCCLATQFLFKAVFEYTLAFQFRNHKLPSIFKDKMKQTKNKLEPPFKLAMYPNMILENGPSIFSYLANKSSSQYLRCIGKSYKSGSNFIIPKYEFSLSRINMSVDESAIMENYKQSENNSINISDLGLSVLDGNVQNSSLHKSVIQNQDQDEKSLHLVSEIKVTEILKVLTSRMYKFNKVDNYEEYEFIGDVVLKMLSTVQVFLEKPQADESQLHLTRANIVCNANLHRKSISKNLYRYILTKRPDQLAPPFKYAPIEGINQSYYEKTNFKLYNENCEIEGFHYIPGKVHADIVEGLIGAFYLHSKQLNDCQLLLYFLDILKKPLLKIDFITNEYSETDYNLPKLYLDFEQRISYKFKNKGHLIQAFTHSSFRSIINIVVDKNNIEEIYQNANRDLKSQQSFLSSDSKMMNKDVTKALPWETFYERYEFVGDSILDLIVVEYLHEKYGTKDEGTLSALKQAGVSNKTLGMIAIRYGMHELILMDYPDNDKVMREFEKILENYNFFLNNPEALMDSNFASVKILGDVFEALVGAIFVDLQLDYTATKSVVMNIIKDFLIHYTDLQTIKKSTNFKYQQYLSKNNYRQCTLRKDTSAEIENGNFRYLLVDRSGNVVDDCWETTEKRAWDMILEKFHQRKGKEGILAEIK